MTPAVAVLLVAAARLRAVHGLRAYDAVQLACASAARDAVPECQGFAAFDATRGVPPPRRVSPGPGSPEA